MGIYAVVTHVDTLPLQIFLLEISKIRLLNIRSLRECIEVVKELDGKKDNKTKGNYKASIWRWSNPSPQHQKASSDVMQQLLFAMMNEILNLSSEIVVYIDGLSYL